MTLGEETIQLLPFRNWGQLDQYKWGMRGKLPGTPSGLEVTPDHIKIAGETVALADPDSCAKLEKAFNEWLTIEIHNLEAARAISKPRKPAAETLPKSTGSQALRFHVERDKRGQVHISCLRGVETVSAIGLTVQGFSGLFSQGLMRKPKALDVGALHDWVELDGELCSFEHGNDDSLKLEALLNAKYLPLTAAGSSKDVLMFANAASPTGFDIQFPVTVGGVAENRRRTLNSAALELLQEPGRCGVLQPGLIIKLSPPTFIFKVKTHDGGETYLAKSSENIVRLVSDDGRERLIDLSQPVNYAKLTVVELAAVFNHPVVNRHAKSRDDLPPVQSVIAPATEPVVSSTAALDPSQKLCPAPVVVVEKLVASRQSPLSVVPSSTPEPQRIPQVVPKPEMPPAPRPNTWLKDVLGRPPIRFDWLTCLIYAKLAEHFGNSQDGNFGPSQCWFIALNSSIDLNDAAFKGVFLTQKGGLGFLGQGRMLRFHRGVVFVGTRDSVQEGIDVNLLAIGLNETGQVLFIVNDDYLTKFGVPAETVKQEISRLANAGASVLSVSQILASPVAVTVIWTVPAEQSNPVDPQALETTRPELR